MGDGFRPLDAPILGKCLASSSGSGILQRSSAASGLVLPLEQNVTEVLDGPGREGRRRRWSANAQPLLRSVDAALGARQILD